ncbi:hypothetical protein QGM71_21295 [Virgibacillus sp. C22-A2]|uniref:DUF2019 domain-containing protein n=1 Tax=Virgibacillus tibetensis TaxID=3042313 RepID=A0ABU6KL21_9BACI|nr:hypothetical protein [Virgibacillus sp. C22-A2]
MKQDTSLLVQEYKKHAIILADTQETGDYKKGNRSSDQLLKISKIMKEDRELAKNVLDSLMESEDPKVLSSCCVDALVLKHRTDEALNHLTKIVNSDLGMMSFNAETTLELYDSEELFELHGVEK